MIKVVIECYCSYAFYSVFLLVGLSANHEYYPKLQHNKLGKGI